MLIPGKVKVTREDLKEVWDKYMEFSDLMCNFSMTYSGVTEDVPVSNAGEQMTTAWWQQVEKNLLDKVTNHRIQVEAAAVHQTATVDQATALTEFEKRDLEIKLKHLALVEENKKKSEEAERIKANAVAQSKYDEILTVSVELDEVLDKVTDWKKATRGEVHEESRKLVSQI